MSKSRDAFRTISEVAEWLDTPAHVLRFWESKFSQVKPVKRAGGRRYYRPADMALLAGIKQLLHEDGLTIKGAQKILREQGVKYVASLSSLDPDAPGEDAPFVEVETPDADSTLVPFQRQDATSADPAGVIPPEPDFPSAPPVVEDAPAPQPDRQPEPPAVSEAMPEPDAEAPQIQPAPPTPEFHDAEPLETLGNREDAIEAEPAAFEAHDPETPDEPDVSAPVAQQLSPDGADSAPEATQDESLVSAELPEPEETTQEDADALFAQEATDDTAAQPVTAPAASASEPVEAEVPDVEAPPASADVPQDAAARLANALPDFEQTSSPDPDPDPDPAEDLAEDVALEGLVPSLGALTRLSALSSLSSEQAEIARSALGALQALHARLSTPVQGG